jgi:uncharacterized protein YbjT (DUF2867 family)
VPFVLLRNGWYLENYTDQLPQITEHGALLGSARDGRVSGASRRDYAAAASAVLTQDGHTGATYELGGEPFSPVLFTDSDDLPRLIDRPATTRQEAVRAALAHSAA